MDYIRINEKDNVLIALNNLKKGQKISFNDISFDLAFDIKKGHKIAINNIKRDDFIIKYGLPIGKATTDIKIGEYVHTHNVKTNLDDNEGYIYQKINIEKKKANDEKYFLGYKRKDGKVAVRNEIWIVPLVGCINSIAKNIETECKIMLNENIDGIYSFTHPYGCSQLGDDFNFTKKLLANLVKHPNAAGVLVLSLGCENLTLSKFKEELGDFDEDRIKFLVMQEVEDEIYEAKKIISELVNKASSYKREKISISKLIIGLKCGGSDGLSGITANPVVGKLSDKIIEYGGSTILTEVPEMFGAEKILLNKCIDEKIFNKSINMIEKYKKYFINHNQVIYENPSPGNKEGGITTLEDKSCGCVQKAGNSYIVDFIDYGDMIEKTGLNLLYAPGNDLISTTALAVAGAHIILFTTGRGTPFGTIVPTIKISSNTDIFYKKNNWFDFNAGRIIEDESLENISSELLEYIIKIASSEKTKQEKNQAREIAIFKDGVIL